MSALQGNSSRRRQSSRSWRKELGVLSLGVALAVGGVVGANLAYNPAAQSDAEAVAIGQVESSYRRTPAVAEQDANGIADVPDAISKVPDYSSPENLAISISWPLYDDGKKADPRSYTHVRKNDADTDAVLPAYRMARERAVETQQWPGNKKGLLADDEFFGRCSAFIATIVVNTVTPEFPQATVRVYPWVSDPANGWVKVGDTEHYDPASYSPGDIFLTRGEGHVFMWIGDYGLYQDVIADSAVGNQDGKGTRTGGLRRSPIDPGTGTDRSGRAYDVWRYSGSNRVNATE